MKVKCCQARCCFSSARAKAALELGRPGFPPAVCEEEPRSFSRRLVIVGHGKADGDGDRFQVGPLKNKSLYFEWVSSEFCKMSQLSLGVLEYARGGVGGEICIVNSTRKLSSNQGFVF